MNSGTLVEWWSFGLQALGYLGVATAFVIGLRQYGKAQTYQKAHVILNLIDQFEEDSKIDAACQMIDWDNREIQIENGKTLKFSNEMLIAALRVQKMDEGFTSEESMIRDCFDAFFDYFHKVNSFWESGIVAFNDLRYFFYWFELLRTVGEYKEIAELQTVFEKYIKTYQFVGIADLIDEYSKHPYKLDLVFTGQVEAGHDGRGLSSGQNQPP
jgi:hypothetical protein